jgi:hypothetical protein
MRVFAIVCCALLIGLAAPDASAQAIPDDVPDRPDYSPGEVNRDRLTERHRSDLSRLFAASQVAVMPFGSGVTTDRTVTGGARLPRGGAVHLSFGARTTQFGLPIFGGPPETGEQTAYIMSLGVDVSGRAVFGNTPAAHRTSLGLGLGTLTGEANMVMLELNPRYRLYEAHRWSIPVGLRLTNVILSDGASTTVRKAFAGVSVGIQMSFAHRDRLNMK